MVECEEAITPIHIEQLTLYQQQAGLNICVQPNTCVWCKCVCDNVHPGCEFEVMPGLHIRYGPSQTGRLIFEVAFVVPDPTDSNAGNAQGTTVNKLLKIFLCSR